MAMASDACADRGTAPQTCSRSRHNPTQSQRRRCADLSGKSLELSPAQSRRAARTPGTTSARS
ncbi:hypothetical protein QJS66_15555 [Kocuria rhizophila]|nr:hypothetical protein QJS66_15555 [Kocuria rhizophila]